MKKYSNSLIVTLAVVLAFIAGFALNSMMPEESKAAAQQQTPEVAQPSFALLMEAKGYVDEFFVKPKPDDKTSEYAIIRAYLESLGDPYTFFIEPAVAASESDALAGRYGGIGVELKRDEQGNFVLYPYPESPAARMGIRDGDIIVKINGTALAADVTMDIVRQSLRGEIVEGAGVTLTVRNISETEERDIFVPFEEILEPSVTWRPVFEAPEIGYINIMRFTSRTPEEFAQAVTELRAAGITALILDLRNNSGGLLQESLLIAGEFLDQKVITIEERVSGTSTMEDTAGGSMLDLPMVVLVNQRTASASEIVAGALQAHGRAILIGQNTYGKGSIQRIFPLQDQSSIHVTTAIWLTPNGQPLDGVGLTPDISMIPDENGRDVELGEAVRHLRAQVAG